MTTTIIKSNDHCDQCVSFPLLFILVVRFFGVNRCDFSVGDPAGSSSVKELPPLRMIERHYFRDTLLGSYDFTFGPIAMPSLHNKWEFEYDMPALTSEQIDEMVSDPYSLSSDSFYFIGSDLILHHKAFYAFRAHP